MEKSAEILSNITVFNKYAKYLPEVSRRETWEECVARCELMHRQRFPDLKDAIHEAFSFVHEKKVLPSMRSLQFAGKPIELSPNRIFNCAYGPVDHPDIFSEAMFLLLGGTGLGYSVQRHHVRQLPSIHKPLSHRPYGRRRYLIDDSIEGWADAVKVLMRSFWRGGPEPDFDFRSIRPKGARLVTSGGKAPGPEPLRRCLGLIKEILLRYDDGAQLKPIDCHDIMCHIGDAVLTGGIRRAALISLFSASDDEMMSAKSGAWWEQHAYRGRANNSVVLLRHRAEKTSFQSIWERIKASGAGEPGIYWTNDKDQGTNPCCEIALRPNQMCNLTTVNVANVESQSDLDERVEAAAFIGTLQASYTDFHYLRPIWRKQCEKEALLGVSMTGIASKAIDSLDLSSSAAIAKTTNEEVAQHLDINPAARVTAIKPEGTSSLVLGCSSGIHGYHNDFYLRRMRLGKNEAIYEFLKTYHPELVEESIQSPHDTAYAVIPVRAPSDAILRHESALDLLDRVKKFHEGWIKPGHVHGDNTHNVSATISIKEDEWKDVGQWMWENRSSYNGLSVLPYDGGTYVQAPFEDCSEEEFNRRFVSLSTVDLSLIEEDDDETDLTGELACAGGSCAIV